tara:strand:- start:49 stop:228 length:180 start_codon:yes stop_codon:yes gene_type:complete
VPPSDGVGVSPTPGGAGGGGGGGALSGLYIFIFMPSRFTNRRVISTGLKHLSSRRHVFP